MHKHNSLSLTITLEHILAYVEHFYALDWGINLSVSTKYAWVLIICLICLTDTLARLILD